MRRLLALLVCLPLFTAALSAAAAEETNVAQGKSYTVFTEAAIENAFPNQVLADAGQLTDGESASDVIGDPNWVQLYRGVFTGVTIDLGEEMAVSGYEMGQLSWLGGRLPFALYRILGFDGRGELLSGPSLGGSENDFQHAERARRPFL